MTVKFIRFSGTAFYNNYIDFILAREGVLGYGGKIAKCHLLVLVFGTLAKAGTQLMMTSYTIKTFTPPPKQNSPKIAHFSIPIRTGCLLVVGCVLSLSTTVIITACF